MTQDFSEKEARELQCRIVPPLALPGAPLLGLNARAQQHQINVIMHTCVAVQCMHWYKTKSERGFCALDTIRLRDPFRGEPA